MSSVLQKIEFKTTQRIGNRYLLIITIKSVSERNIFDYNSKLDQNSLFN